MDGRVQQKKNTTAHTFFKRSHLLPMVALFFLIGCISIFHITVGSWLFGLFALGLLLGILRRRAGLSAGMAVALCAFCLGALHANAVFECPLPEEGSYEITAVVSGGTRLRSDDRISFALSDVALDGTPVSGKACCSLHYEEEPPALFDGARVRFMGRVYHPDGKSGGPRFDFRLWMRQEGLAFGIAAYQGLSIENTPETAAVCDPFFRIREWIAAQYKRSMGENGRIAMALLMNEHDGLSDDEYAAFETLGIAHIMSVSGLHVTLLGGFLLYFFSRIRADRRLSLLLIGLLLTFYCGATGFSAAAVRAAVMLILTMTARLCRRSPDRLTVLMTASLSDT